MWRVIKLIIAYMLIVLGILLALVCIYALFQGEQEGGFASTGGILMSALGFIIKETCY